MAYGLNPRLFVEHGPTVTAAEQQVSRSSTVYRSWRALNEQCRLALVDKALKPANDVIDAYPLAL